MMVIQANKLTKNKANKLTNKHTKEQTDTLKLKFNCNRYHTVWTFSLEFQINIQ